MTISMDGGFVDVGSMSGTVGVAVGVEVGVKVGVGGNFIVSDVELITGLLVAVGDSGECVAVGIAVESGTSVGIGTNAGSSVSIGNEAAVGVAVEIGNGVSAGKVDSLIAVILVIRMYNPPSNRTTTIPINKRDHQLLISFDRVNCPSSCGVLAKSSP